MAQGWFSLEYAGRCFTRMALSAVVCVLSSSAMKAAEKQPVLFSEPFPSASEDKSNTVEANAPASAKTFVTVQPRLETGEAARTAAMETKPSVPGQAQTPPDTGRPQVRLVGMKTDAAKRYKFIVPPLPVPPFTSWRRWLREHEESVHCALEWRDENGQWWRGELRSTQFDTKAKKYRVGWGEFPATGYDAYGIYISPGRLPRQKDEKGRPLTITLDEEIDVDYRLIEREMRKYGAKNRRRGEPGTGGRGEENVGLGGPAYKPSQNSNTFVGYVLRQSGVNRPAPHMAIGWDTVPQFPYSADADTVPLDSYP